jgi:hypothetical protein
MPPAEAAQLRGAEEMQQGSVTSPLKSLTAFVLLLLASYASDRHRQCDWDPRTLTTRIWVCHCYDLARGTIGNVRVEVSCGKGRHS